MELYSRDYWNIFRHAVISGNSTEAYVERYSYFIPRVHCCWCMWRSVMIDNIVCERCDRTFYAVHIVRLGLESSQIMLYMMLYMISRKHIRLRNDLLYIVAFSEMLSSYCLTLCHLLTGNFWSESCKSFLNLVQCCVCFAQRAVLMRKQEDAMHKSFATSY